MYFKDYAPKVLEGDLSGRRQVNGSNWSW